MNLHDLHTHTNLSDASFPLSELVETEAQLGRTLGVSDHLFCCGIYTLTDVADYLCELEHYNVYRGAEVNMEHDSSLPDALDAKLDYVIASVHAMPDGRGGFVPLGEYFSKKAGFRSAYTKNYSSDMNRYYLAHILRLIEKKFTTQRVDILGHATVLPPYEELYGTKFVRDWENAVISLCVRHGVAIEISGLWRAPNTDFINRAKEAGAIFSSGSDCHDRLQIGVMDYVERVAEEVGLTEEDFFTPRRVLDEIR